ncbi:hypothetical protein QPK13_15155 [Photorhabdus tasmaniensis]
MYIVPILFFLSFVFSIINFSLGGMSIYFYMFIPFIDINYLKWIISLKIKKNMLIYSCALVLIAFLVSINSGSLYYFIKPILLFFSVAYIVYLYIHRYSAFKLVYYFTTISVIFAVAQFILSYIGDSTVIEPPSIADMLWGKYAIQSRGRFDDGVLFQYRVAGLSKEPGFFSSFLMCIFLVYLYDVRIKSKTLLLFFVIGIILSLSKITVAFGVIVPIIYLFDKYVIKLDKIHLLVGALIYILLCVCVVYVLYNTYDFISKTYTNPWFAETYLHRSIGYYVLTSLFEPSVISSFIWGGITEHLSEVIKEFPFLANLRFVNIQPDIVFFSSGGAYIILQYSFLFYAIFILFLRFLGVGFYSFVIFSLFSSNVNYFAYENWIILGYVFMFVCSSSKKINKGILNGY